MRVCVAEGDDYPVVAWRAARAAFDKGVFASVSVAELAILDFAIALARGRFEFHLMDGRRRDLLVEASGWRHQFRPYPAA
ncbi:hypothetical protein ACWEJ6_50215, partial [Nonomuraea sp. NPDC004702]